METLYPRIKICGLTRAEDVRAAAEAGVDALGFVFYPSSPRFVEPEKAACLARLVPPFVTIVGLFVNAVPETVRETLAMVPLHLLQFHGEEDEVYCQQFGLPYIKAIRVKPGSDLLQCVRSYPSAQAILLDAFVEEYGGVGKAFDWALIPPALPKPLILSGGLHAGNVREAIVRTKPAAVDVSSGVEMAKGIKDAAKMREFVSAVRSVGAGTESVNGMTDA